MNGAYREPGGGIGLIILLVVLYLLFKPVPGPINGAAGLTSLGSHRIFFIVW